MTENGLDADRDVLPCPSCGADEYAKTTLLLEGFELWTCIECGTVADSRIVGAAREMYEWE